MSSQTEDPPNRQDSQTLNPDRSTGNGVSAKQATTETGKGESPVGDAAPLARKVVTVNGERFFEFRVSVSTEEHLNNLRNMPMRQDDVIIAAYPKSGTHWMWEVVQMLTSGKAEYESRSKEYLMLEFNDAEQIEAVTSPRIINSHLFLRYLSKEIVTKGIRVLHVLRNPKDIAVSSYHHVRQRRDFKDTGFLAFAQKFLEGRDLPGNFQHYFAYLPEMEKWQKEHPDVPFMNLYYEDMKQNPVVSVKRLARFLGRDTSESLCADIVQACSFNELKKASETKQTLGGRGNIFKGGKLDMYRKGEVGDWKNHFTVALSEQFDAVMAERLRDCVYTSQLQYEYRVCADKQ